MVIVRLEGGLGNQLFQYAAGRALSDRLCTALKFDISAYRTDPKRSYELHAFHIDAQVATEGEIAAFQAPTLSPHEIWGLRLAERIGFRSLVQQFRPRGVVIQERRDRHAANLASAAGDVFLIGYWQSEDYFGHIRPRLLREFTVKYPPGALSSEYSQMIRGSTSAVAVHVRRGDYISEPKTNAIHGVCGADYYSRAVQYLRERVATPHFFVFSDDLAWARANLRLRDPMTFVEQNVSDPAYEDLRLMSCCRHHIIANSSYSWWGAWLATASDQIVVTPRQWFQDISMYSDHIVPARWIRL